MKNSAKKIILAGVFALAAQGLSAQSAPQNDAQGNQDAGNNTAAAHSTPVSAVKPGSYVDLISSHSSISRYGNIATIRGNETIGLSENNHAFNLREHTEHTGLFNICSMEGRLRGNLLNFHRGKKHRFGIGADKDSVLRLEFRWGGKGDHFKNDSSCSNTNANGLSGALLEGVDIGRDLFEFK